MVCLGFEPREAVWQVQTIPPTAKIVMSKELFQLDSNLRPLESKTVSVTSLDDFWKFLTTIFLVLVAQLFDAYLGYFEKCYF